MAQLITRIAKRCVLFVCPTLLASPYLCVAEVVAQLVVPFRRPELVCHRCVADHAHCWVHVVDPVVVEFYPCLQEYHGSDDLSPRLLSRLLEQ